MTQANIIKLFLIEQKPKFGEFQVLEFSILPNSQNWSN